MARDVYNIIDRYENGKERIKENEDISSHNTDLILEFLEEKGKELRNRNGRTEDDKIRFHKTLYKYTGMLKNIGEWFDKPLDELNKNDIEQFYNDFEEGKIKTPQGNRYKRSTRQDYYKKLFKSDFGKLLGEDIYEWCREIMTLRKKERPVRYFEFEELDKMVPHIRKTRNKALIYLLFDTGMRIGTVLNLRKNDFEKKEDKDGIDYYSIRIKADYTKSKRQRTVTTWIDETAKYLDLFLENLDKTEKLFNISYNAARKTIKRAAEKADVTTVEPPGESIKVKDFRSSCAIHWLNQSIGIDGIKARLGHKPSSRVIDRYVTYLGLDSEPQRKEIKKANYKELKEEYEKSQAKIKSMKQELNKLRNEFNTFTNSIIKEELSEKEMEKLKKLGNKYSKERVEETINRKHQST